MGTPHLGLRQYLLALLTGFGCSFAAPTFAATVFWTNPGGGSWNTATNWSGGTVPTAADDVHITMDGTYTVVLDVNATIASLTLGGTTGEQTLVNFAPTLTLTTASTVQTGGVLAMSGGTLDAAGTLTVNGLLRCSGGAAYGTITVATSGACELTGSADRYLVGSLANSGRVTWSGANNLFLAGDARFENLPTGTIEIQNDQTVVLASGSPQIVNAGLIRKTAGAGATALGVPLDSSGTLEVQTGAILYAAGSVFRDGSSFTGAGLNLLAAAGPVTLEGAIHTDNLELGGGNTFVAGTNTIDGTLTWTRGWIGGAADVTVATNGVLSVAGGDNKGVAGALRNQGRLIWSGSGQIWQDAGVIDNQAGGVFEVQTDAAMLVNGALSTNRNAGLLRKTAGAGLTTLAVPLDNSGTLDVQTGAILYAAGSAFRDGSSFTGAGLNLLAAEGVVTLEGAIHTDNLQLGGGNTVITGVSTIDGVLTWTMGWIGGAADLTVATNGVLRVAGVDNKGLAGTLRNQGRLIWSGTGQIWQNAGVIDNQAGGVFELQTDAALLVSGALSTNRNAGLITKTSGTGTIYLAVPLDNLGTLEVQTGAALYAAGSVFHDGSSFTGAGLNVLAAEGVVTLDGAIHTDNLQLAGGNTVIAGTSTIDGVLTWTMGWIGGAADLTLATNGVLNVAGADNKGLAGVIHNQGRILWSGTGQIWQDAGVIDNQAGGVFELQTDAALLVSGALSTNRNAGLITKTSGTGTTYLAVPLDNPGMLNVQTGVVLYAAGSVFRDGSSFTGTGINLLAAEGVVTLDGAIHTDNLQLGGANTVVTGTNTIDGTLTWTMGWIGGAATMTVSTNSTLLLTGTVDKGLAGTLDNIGHVIWSDSGRIAISGGTLNNLPGGLWENLSDSAIYDYSGVGGAVHNAGLFRKTGGSGVTSVSTIPFENTGAVDVQTGLILFACPYTQTGGRLNLGLNSLADFGRVQFTGTAPLTGTLAATLSTSFRPRAGDAFTVLTYPDRAGAFTGFDLPTVAAWQTNDTLYSATAVTLTVLNAQPVLTAIDDHTLDEETTLNVAPTVEHPDLDQTVTYALTQAPSGAHIDTATGLLSWTPTEAQGPGTNTVTIQATDNGTPPLSNSQSFTVTVNEVNRSPMWTAPAALTNSELTSIQLPSVATDPDFPTNTLSFSLLSGPAGATVGPHSGIVSWTPTESQGPGAHLLTVKVSDNGQPLLSITNQMTITVSEVNSPPSLTVPGAQTLDELATLSVTNSVLDTDLPTNTLTFSLVSAPPNAQINPTSGVVTWTPTEAQGPTNVTIRVRSTDNGSPTLSDTREFTVAVREVNLPPALEPLPEQVILEGEGLTVTNVATDPDLPANLLTFSLVAPPTGFTIDPALGTLTWSPAPEQIPSTNLVTVRVTDNGTPGGSDERTFTAVVVPVPSLRMAADGDEVRIYWSAVAPGFVLQSAPTLEPPIDWSNTTNAVGYLGEDCVVTNRVADAPIFFQLKRPW